MEEGIKLKKRVGEVFFVGLLVAFLAASLECRRPQDSRVSCDVLKMQSMKEAISFGGLHISSYKLQHKFMGSHIEIMKFDGHMNLVSTRLDFQT